MERLYIWLEGEAGVGEPDASIEDVPGESDLRLIADAIARGELGRYFPVRLQFATRPDPEASNTRSVDVARLLRDHNIRHRRRYEVITDV